MPVTGDPSPRTQINVVMADALVIGPDDRLIVKINDPSVGPKMMQDLSVHFARMGMADRSLVLMGDLELTKVEPTKEK